MPLHPERREQNRRTPGFKPSSSNKTSSASKANGRARTNGQAHHDTAPFDLAVDALQANGYSGIALIRKRPLDEQWTQWCKTPPSLAEIAAHKGRGYNIGVATGYNGTVGLDVDSDDPAIDAAIRRVIPASPVAKRGQKGRTDFYHSSRPLSSRRFVDKNGEIIVELLGDGRQSAIPPSIHPDTRQPYDWLTPATLLNTPAADLPACPDDLGDLLQKELAPFLAPERKPRPQRSGPPPILTEEMQKRHRAWALAKIDARVKELAAMLKPGRNRAVFALASSMGKFVHHNIISDAEVRVPALTACDTNGLTKENGRHDCEKTIDNGLRYALSDVLEDLKDRPRQSRARAHQQESEQNRAPPTEELFSRTPTGAIAKSEGNIRLALAKAGIKLSYDCFARQRIIRGLPGHGPDLMDAAIDAMWIRFEREHRVRFGREHFNAVIRVEAHANSFHPVRDYLASTKWDGTPRLDKWLISYAGAEDTELNRQFSRLSLIAGVRRVRTPGTKFDAMLVLEGPEGRNKSTLFETLASPEWFSDDAPLNAEARETIERLRGKWIIEAADLSAVKRADVDRLKAFLSRNKDTATLKFERETTTALRECIFVGTTNSSEYLQSKTGNRRFWPVKIGKIGKIDLDALGKDRDQIWAEAAHAEANGLSHMLPEQFWSIAAAEQEKRRESDAWEGAIATWLEQRRSTNPLVSAAEVASGVLSVQLRDLDGLSQRRITEAMRLAGWSKDAGKTVRGVHLWGPREGR